jgi:hypothetical protein
MRLGELLVRSTELRMKAMNDVITGLGPSEIAASSVYYNHKGKGPPCQNLLEKSWTFGYLVI